MLEGLSHRKDLINKGQHTLHQNLLSSTLSAVQAGRITNKVSAAEEPHVAVIRQLKQQVHSLQALLAAAQGPSAALPGAALPGLSLIHISEPTRPY